MGAALPGTDSAGGRGSVLAIRPFRRLLAVMALSSTGDWLAFLATTALAADLVDGLSNQAYATGGVLVLRLVPAVLLGPLAGALADRLDRRTTMVACDLARAALIASIPLVGTLQWLLVASFLLEVCSLLWIPAKEASIPNLVAPQQLEAAGGLSLLVTYGSAPVAGALFAALGVLPGKATDLALYADAATFLVSAAVVAGLAIPSPGRRAGGSAKLSLLRDLREAVDLLRGTPVVRGLLVGMLGALAAAGTLIAQGKLYARQIVAGGDAAYGLLFGALFVGLAAGLAGAQLLRGAGRRAFGPAIVVAGLAVCVLALVPNLAVAVICALVMGAAAGVAYVLGIAMLGREVDDAIRGRVFGLVQTLMRVDLLVVTAATPFITGAIGMHVVDVAGLAVDVNGIGVTMFAGGLVAVGVGVVSGRLMDDRRGAPPLRAELLERLRRRADPALHAGLLVAFEGGEGAGKSTQVRLLAERLRAAGREVVVTFEPGATPTGARIRQLLLDPATTLSARAEALLYAADRAQHVDEVVRPALERGAVVLTDRFVDSSLAYQGAGRALDVEEVARLSRWATGGLRPDLVVLLDVDPAVGLVRAGRTGDPDRLEQESLEFHRRVRDGFRALAAGAPKRYLVVDAARDPHEVADVVATRVEAEL